MAKFICKKHNKEFLAFGFSIFYKDNRIVYKDSNKRLLRCPDCDCNHPEIESIDEKVDYTTINIGKFSSLSLDQKRELLQKRASLHQSKFKERKEHLDKNFTGNLKSEDI